MGFNQIEHNKLTSLLKMTNEFESNGTYSQIEHKILTSLVKMTNEF